LIVSAGFVAEHVRTKKSKEKLCNGAVGMRDVTKGMPMMGMMPGMPGSPVPDAGLTGE
jgi:hypothetical protein